MTAKRATWPALRRPWSHGALALVLCGATAVVWGCRTTHVVTADATGRPQFEQLTLVYEIVEPTLAAVAGEAPLTLAEAQAHPYRAAVVSRQSRVPQAGRRADLRLTIQTPTPAGAADRATVTLAAATDTPGEWQVVAERSLPRAELELLFVHLVNGGLCDSESRPAGTAHIALEIDGHGIEKPWTREPRLDRLAVETYDATR